MSFWMTLGRIVCTRQSIGLRRLARLPGPSPTSAITSDLRLRSCRLHGQWTRQGKFLTGGNGGWRMTTQGGNENRLLAKCKATPAAPNPASSSVTATKATLRMLRPMLRCFYTFYSRHHFAGSSSTNWWITRGKPRNRKLGV